MMFRNKTVAIGYFAILYYNFNTIEKVLRTHNNYNDILSTAALIGFSKIANIATSSLI